METLDRPYIPLAPLGTRIPEPLRERLRRRAFEQRTSVQALVTRAVELLLEAPDANA